MLTLRGSPVPRRGSELNQLNIIPDGSILVKDGLVQEVGPTRRVENLAEAKRAIEVSAAGRVVLPGFVDSHTHLFFPASGPENGVDTGAPGLQAITGMRLRSWGRVHLEAMARHGTTTVEVKTGCGPDASSELKILRAVSTLRDEPLRILPSFLFRTAPENEDDAGMAQQWVCTEFLPRIRKRRLVCFADLAWEEGMELTSLPKQYFTTAYQLGLTCKVHADGICPGAVSWGVRSNAVSIDHLEHATSADVTLLARSNAVATVLPWASFHRDGVFAPARALADAGAALALATNFNSHHTPTLSMQAVVALACQHMGLTPAEAISAATINGAHALGYAARTGSLERGKSADLLMLNISDYRDLARQLGVNLVHLTMRRGVFIYEEGVVAPRAAQELRGGW